VKVPELRPPEQATATSPDIHWVLHSIAGRNEDAFSILRPTSPFRTEATIARAMARFVELGERGDSIRAVEPCRQHPGKMWLLNGELMRPLLQQPKGETPFHSRQYQSLPTVYAQNSSLEIAWSRVLDDPVPTTCGRRTAPFLTEGCEGFSIDYPDDLRLAEWAVAHGEAVLSVVPTPSGRRSRDAAPAR
jgi:CMP-N,N'-diacetyllegionaminic acid synthase